ncbi:hypothetical protein [Acinetobacter larvae]|uniref:Uncharacterized protein n=1 Tax=Acinetobacter larvae TaxID=1789224 RepID=A0A1B2LYR0_9GAMM|nr:hypothetical protein [Acinetobacter larvae]AOA58061.1 hypothetical protein BFG52_06655 [Acinetobacter larvae]
MLEFKLWRKASKQPYSEYKDVKQITVLQLKQMYNIYKKYYENTSFELFESDFLQKTGVFLIFAPIHQRVVGFSTITERDFLVGEKAQHGFFSGDTIIEKEYWGTRALQRAMMRYIFRYKLKYPTQSVYWLLISKGFKTYLLLANNYQRYYPNLDHHHSYLKDYVQSYCETYFKSYYDSRTGLLNFGDDYQALKQQVAPIHASLRQQHLKIDFFEQCNPTWVQGTELPCIGEVTWRDMFAAIKGHLLKPISKGRADAQDDFIELKPHVSTTLAPLQQVA